MTNKVELVESVTKQIDLTREQVIALHDIGRSLYRKSPQGSDSEETMVDCNMNSSGKWYVTVQNAAGVIAIPGLQLVIRSKIPLNHLIYLFSRAKTLPRFVGRPTYLAEEESFAELIIAWFVESVFQVIKSDPLLDYSEISEILSVVRGALDQTRTHREIMSGRLSFVCCHERYTLDNPANRLLKAALGMSLRILPRGSSLRKKAHFALSFLSDVGTLGSGDLYYETDRRFAHYRDPIILAKAILSGSGRSIEHGKSLGWSFLIRTPAAIEMGIREVLRTGLIDKCNVYSRTGSVGNGYKVSPDLWFDPMAAVADIKYKLTPKLWARPDLYQCVAFAAALHSKRASILSFHNEHHHVPKPVTFGSISVVPLTWSTKISSPDEAARDLCDTTAGWLSDGVEVGRPNLVLYNGSGIDDAA